MIDKIIEFRKKHGLSQRQTADIIGMPIYTLQHWEQGQRTPSEWIIDLIIFKLERTVKEGVK